MYSCLAFRIHWHVGASLDPLRRSVQSLHQVLTDRIGVAVSLQNYIHGPGVHYRAFYQFHHAYARKIPTNTILHVRLLPNSYLRTIHDICVCRTHAHTDGLDDRGIESLHGLGIFLFTTASRLVLGPTHPPIQWVPGALSLG
jgi:hypothetical protein